jgi:uncharacterized protein YjbJ (UPF0337 family)
MPRRSCAAVWGPESAGTSGSAEGRSPREPISEQCDVKKDSGRKSGVMGVAEGAKGKAKEAVGALTGREAMRREGIVQQGKAAAQREAAAKEAQADKALAEPSAREAEQRSHQR